MILAVVIFLQLRKEAWKKFRTSTGLEPVDLAIPVISYPQFTYDLFHMHHSLTYLSREHMNPQLTCSQRQWLHSSVGRASHRYREVTGSSPVEVLNFFQASLRNCKNCDHNCEDHSSFDFISAVHIWFISYASFTMNNLVWYLNNFSLLLLQEMCRNNKWEFKFWS